LREGRDKIDRGCLRRQYTKESKRGEEDWFVSVFFLPFHQKTIVLKIILFFYLPLFNSVPEKSVPRYQNIGRTFVLPHAPSGYAYAYNTPISPVYHYSTLHMDVPGSSYNVEVKIQIS